MAIYDNVFSSIANFLGQGGRSTPTAYSIDTDSVRSRAGAQISPETVVRNDTVFACVNLIADTIAQTSVSVVDKRQNSYTPLVDHAVSRLMDNPNGIQTRYEFIHSILWNMLVYGNAYVYINGSGAGRELVILPSDFVRIESNAAGRPTYNIYHGATLTKSYTQDEIIHFRDIATSNIQGISRVMSCADLVGMSIALDNSVSDILKNASNVSGVLTTDSVLTPEKKMEIGNAWKMAYGENGKPGATAILDAGLSYSQVEFLTIADADAINLKRQLINRCAAIFRVPAQYLEQEDNNKYNNVSQKKNGFFSDTLSPMLVNIEEKLTQRLLQRVDRNLCVRFDRTALVKGDLVSQVGIATQAVSSGIWSNNEAREFLGYEAMDQEGADELTMGGETQPARTDMPGVDNGVSREGNQNGN